MIFPLPGAIEISPSIAPSLWHFIIPQLCITPPHLHRYSIMMITPAATDLIITTTYTQRLPTYRLNIHIVLIPQSTFISHSALLQATQYTSFSILLAICNGCALYLEYHQRTGQYLETNQPPSILFLPRYSSIIDKSSLLTPTLLRLEAYTKRITITTIPS